MSEHGHSYAFGLLAFSDRQTFSRINAVHPFVIVVEKLWTQNVVNHSAAPAPAGVGNLDDLVSQLHIERAGLAVMAMGISVCPTRAQAWRSDSLW